MPVFSIIIPVYNAENTLQRCLDSVCSQLYQDYETILIDDGSIDNSFDICRQYESKDKRFKTVRQPNGGPSCARNSGLREAKGKWICFVDSDDSIEANYLLVLSKAIDKYDTDAVFYGYNKVYKNGNIQCFALSEKQGKAINIAIELSEKDMFGYTWIKTFRRETIKNTIFDPELDLFEDEVFSCQVVSNCSNACVIGEQIYNYYVDNNSLIERTHNDYCTKSDRLYYTWKALLENHGECQAFLLEKANTFVSRCYYYAFERDVPIKEFFLSLKKTMFFLEHTRLFEYDDAVRNDSTIVLRLARVCYRIKAFVYTALHQKV